MSFNENMLLMAVRRLTYLQVINTSVRMGMTAMACICAMAFLSRVY